ncbi:MULTISPECIES: GNAT family N-acetyltransferase [Ferrimicrobium]|jgi:GNAT superfamily N-acetyltransferase|uniref:GNAT family N-acetyltransferase n=1 Tax=Ferrimicrobium TaxID=121038 RepID=UPI0023F42011|nr:MULTISPECIES: GNAT family N-acetyltransferase [Ferrimicrobium]
MGPQIDQRAILLAAYDDELRDIAEMQGALSWDRDGPLWRALFEGGGFVSYKSLDHVEDLDELIARTVVYFAGMSQVKEFEWKSRGHDRPSDLDARLRAAGLVPEELETVMVGEAADLAVNVEQEPGVIIRRVDQLPEPERTQVIAAASAMAKDVFNGGPSAEEMIANLDRKKGNEQFWVAEAANTVVCVGRLSRIAGSAFASLWGGATHPEWRGKGIYRALTAARAKAAIAERARYLHSDCTAMSRPILERSGLVAVTTTRPYIWRR